MFIIGTILGLAQICFATRKDLNNPYFPTEEDNTVKEGNGNVSTIIVVGMLASLIIGGVPLGISVLSNLKEGFQIPNFTYIFVSVAAVLSLVASLLYTFIGIRGRFDRLSEGD